MLSIQRTKPFLLFIALFFTSTSIAQKLTVRPYEFVTRNERDTVAAEVGTFRTPLDYADPDSDSIALTFVRFPSTNDQPGSPIVYLAGGPGGSGIATARGERFSLFMKLREVADVIAFDQRGTGNSNVLPDCPYRLGFAVDKALDRTEYAEQSAGLVERCIAYYDSTGYDLTHYNTSESARDLNELRKVLGEDAISLWGISYGSHLAFEYIRQFEERTHRVVLAALEGPDETIKLPSGTQRFVRELAERAKTNYGNAPVYPNLLDHMQTVHARLAKNPVKATYTTRSGEEETVAISLFDLQLVVASNYLRDPEDSAELPALYAQLVKGDFSDIAPTVAIFKRYVYGSFRPMAVAMDLQSGISDERSELLDTQRDTTFLGSTINFMLHEWMQRVDFRQLPPDFRTLPQNEVDALLLSGMLDGRTYYWAGRETASAFTKGHHVLVDNAGHNLFMTDPVIGDLILDFFRGVAPETDRITLDPVPFK